MHRKTILKIYKLLLKSYGRQGWWPLNGKHEGRQPKTENQRFEICLGAILTQNTTWKNVEKALAVLRKNNLLNKKGIISLPEKKLASLIRPAGYYNQKARKIKLFANHKGKISRESLLNLWGIGPETADSILLYAYNKPYFIIDAYTKRIFSRLGFKAEATHSRRNPSKCEAFAPGFKAKDYNGWQLLLTEKLPEDLNTHKEYHALLVEHAKRFCKSKIERELCLNCPINIYCRVNHSIKHKTQRKTKETMGQFYKNLRNTINLT